MKITTPGQLAERLKDFWRRQMGVSKRSSRRRSAARRQRSLDQLEGRVLLSANVLAGDLVVVAYNSSEDVPVDSIALMSLADIPDGETVFLTDRGWQTSTGTLRPTSLLENTITWVTSGVTAGKIIRISTGTPDPAIINASSVVASFIGTSYGTLSGSLDPDLTSGDQLLIYQTADNNKDSTAVFVSAFNADAPSLFNAANDDGPFDGWSDSDTGNLNNTSKLPPGLTAVTTSGGAGNAFGIGTYVNSGADEFDNYIYNGPTSPGTRATWVTRINTFANWLGRNTTTYDLTPTPGLPGALDNLDTLPFPSPPTATIVVADTSLIAGETSLVTFTFSGAVTGFTNADVTVANGTLSAVSSGDGGITWTASLTPTAGLTDSTNVVSVDLTGVSGLIPGVGTATSNNYAIDTQRPLATIVVADTSLIAGETSLVTITFSEAVTGFTNSDLTVANGTLSAVSSGDSGVTWTATLTPTANTTDSTNVVTLNNTGVSDVPGNAGTGTTNSNNYAIDTARPTAAIVVADTLQIAGETSLVTITFSEAVILFTNADLTIANGTLSAVSSGDGGVTWTATLTPTSNLTDSTNVITLANTGVSDAAGNAGTGTTDSNNYAIDTQLPTATIVVADTSLIVGETSLVTITFSEAVTGFTNADLTIPNGNLSAVSSGDGGVTWTATFTPTANVNDGNNVISLANTGVTDGAGNTGTGTTDSNNFTINTEVAPTATIVVSEALLTVGETSLVTITFSEAVTGFTNADLTIANGTLSAVSSGDGGITWTATLTPTANLTDATNVITLDLTGVTGQVAGVGTQDSNNYAIDTQLPTATIVVADSSLIVGETSLVTITFSEAVTGFTNTDLTVANGTLSAVSTGDGGVTWTATLTPTSNLTDSTNVITLANTGVSDAAGNAGTGTTDSNNYAIDTERPTATIVVADTSLIAGEISLVTITFSEAVTGFANVDLTVPNGTLSTASTGDGGITWTATFTPTPNVNDATNVITLNNPGVNDAAGNSGTGATNSNNFTIDTEQFDFGDAPDTYGTLLATNGARHVLTGPTLGATRDTEADGQPNAGATGDGADEDGVTPDGPLVVGQTTNITINVQGSAGFVNAWSDLNRDGDWDELGEQFLTNYAVVAGDNVIPFAVPNGFTPGDIVVRYRLTSASVASPSPTGLLPDGEVEDYVGIILSAPVISTNAISIAEGETLVLGSGQINTTDPDNTPSQLTYTASGVTHGRFELAATPGVAITSFTQAQVNSGAVQFVHDGAEITPSFSLNVTDGMFTSGASAGVVTFTNVNDAPAAVGFENETTSLPENTDTVSAIKLADIVVTDDALGSNALSLTGADAAFFEIVGTELRLKAGTVLNFEAKASYSVTVRVDDAGVGATPDATVNFTLAVTDVNEAPTAVALQNTTTTLPENTSTASAIKLADIVVTDDALGSNTMSLAGADAAVFEIVGTALRLKAGTTLNFEAKASYSVTVNVNDPAVGVTPDASTNFTLTITNTNDAPVLDNLGSPFVVLGVGARQSLVLRQGVLVTDLLARGAGGDPIDDEDAGALSGIAVTAIDRTYGTFQFTLVSSNPAESDWTDVEAAGAISATSALLLPANARLRFKTALVPHHEAGPQFLALESKLDAGLTFRAWDETSGAAGGRANTTTNGGTTAFSSAVEISRVYFEARLWRHYNRVAGLNVDTLEAEFTEIQRQALINNPDAFEDRSTDAFTGFSVLMSAVPELTTIPVYRLYFGVQFNEDGTETDMGYRYLTTNLAEAEELETKGPADKRATREGAYFRELGINSGTGIIGYIFSTQPPGTSAVTQIYRTDLVNKPTRPAGTSEGGSPTSFRPQESGDHVYTTNIPFESARTGTWRTEALRGFARELSPNVSAVSSASTVSANSGRAEVSMSATVQPGATTVGTETTVAPEAVAMVTSLTTLVAMTGEEHLDVNFGLIEVNAPNPAAALLQTSPSSSSVPDSASEETAIGTNRPLVFPGGSGVATPGFYDEAWTDTDCLFATLASGRSDLSPW